MEVDLPKRIFPEGNEPETDKINNSCRTSILKMLNKNLPSEYREVGRDPVFRDIMALNENKVRYSARLIHSFMCRQLHTSKKHELWFVFGRRPLRFSMQEFYAVTGLKHEKVEDPGFQNWVEDNGFWSNLLNKGTSICMQKIRKYIKDCNQWKRVDRLRLVYVSIIGGLLMPLDEKTAIPDKYIKLVMNLDKLRAYHWGIDSFDHLLKEMDVAKEQLTKTKFYSLHGFSYAFQIWIMEAIPDIGKMMGEKISDNSNVFPRCSNWKNVSALSYPEIRSLEALFGKEAVLHPFISSTGNNDVVHAIEYMRSPPDVRDERVDRIHELITSRKVWTDHIWEVMVPDATCVRQAVVDEDKREDEGETEDEGEKDNEEETDDEIGDTVGNFSTPKAEVTSASASTSRKGKSKVREYSVTERKQKVLCDRSAGKEVANNEDMKRFMKELMEASVTSIKSAIEVEIAARFDVVHAEIRELKDLYTTTTMSATRGDTPKTAKTNPATTRNQSQSQQKKVTQKKNL